MYFEEGTIQLYYHVKKKLRQQPMYVTETMFICSETSADCRHPEILSAC